MTGRESLFFCFFRYVKNSSVAFLIFEPPLNRYPHSISYSFIHLARNYQEQVHACIFDHVDLQHYSSSTFFVLLISQCCGWPDDGQGRTASTILNKYIYFNVSSFTF